MINGVELGQALIDLLKNCNKINESSIIDYKVHPHKDKCEFYKDILSLLNAYERPEEDRFLIYGVEDKNKHLVGYSYGEACDEACYQDWYKKITPRPFIEFCEIDASEVTDMEPGLKQFGCFYIPSTNFGSVFELNSTVENKNNPDQRKWRRYEVGTSFFRHASQVQPMTEADRENIRAIKKAKIESIGEDLRKSLSSSEIQYLLTAILVGSWDIDNEYDKKALSELSGLSDSEWQFKTQEIAFKHKNLIKSVGSTYTINNRIDILKSVSDLFDANKIDSIKGHIINILCTVNDSDTEFFGLRAAYSDQMRKGVAAFVALAGSGIIEMSSSCRNYLHNFI